jgi:hypothetical protein
MAQSSTDLHQQLHILLGHYQHLHLHSSNLTLIKACQAADELRDAQFPHGGPALNHRPLDSELKTFLLDTLSASRLGAYKNLY